jgi:glycosyltransferase involved in cell wall biosynthesis
VRTPRPPSVAILVDDLVTWQVSGFQPTGIQRIVFELLDTACARTDIRAWPAVSIGGGPAGERLPFVEVNPEDLQWETFQVSASRRLRSLRRARRMMRRLPLPRLIRRRFKTAYAQFARSLGGIRAVDQGAPDIPDVLLVPGPFWGGNTTTVIARIAGLGVPVRLIIYDLFPVRNPEWFPRQFCLEYQEALDQLVPLCDRIVTLSEAVANQVAERHPASAGRIRIAVPTLGAHAPRSGPSWGATPAPVAGPFLLALGTVEPRKNHRVLLEAWRLALEDPRIAGSRLVIAGQRGWKAGDIEAEIARDAERLGIVRLVQATDQVVEALYRDCLATVHASWAEGFGLPARESVVRGIPTLMSSTIPRDGLPAGTYRLFDPGDPAQLAAEMIGAIVAGPIRTPVFVGKGTGWESVLSALVDE